MMRIFYIVMFLCFQMEVLASNEKYIIKSINREAVLKICNAKSRHSSNSTSFLAIKSMLGSLTNINNGFDILVTLENGKFNSSQYNDFSEVQKIYVHGTKQVTTFKTGLTTIEGMEGLCLRVIVPDDLKLAKDAFYVSNDPSFQLDLNILPDVEAKFNKLHFESCKKKYCINKHFGDDCNYRCIKPNKLFATSDLDKNKIMEYWYDTLSSIGKIIFVVEPEMKGSSLLIHGTHSKPVD